MTQRSCEPSPKPTNARLKGASRLNRIPQSHVVSYKARREGRSPMGREDRGDRRHGGTQHLGLAFWLPQLAAEKTHSAHRHIIEIRPDRRSDRADVPAKRPAALD